MENQCLNVQRPRAHKRLNVTKYDNGLFVRQICWSLKKKRNTFKFLGFER